MLFVILSLLTHFAQGAIPTGSIPLIAPTSTIEMPFFKSPESRFPSGSASLETLQKQQLHAKWTQEKFYKWKTQLFRLDEIRPVLAIHLSRFVIDQRTKKRLIEYTVSRFFVSYTQHHRA